MLTRRWFVATAAAAGAWTAAPRRAQSQAAGKLARMVVGFAPGGSSDVTARLLIDQMKGYASTVIIDNRPGAGGRIAVEAVKAGAPDGSVILLSPASMIVLYPHLYKPLGYDPVQDFVAIGVADARKQVRIGQGAFHGVVARQQPRPELIQRSVEWLQAAAVILGQCGLAKQQVN